MGLPKKKPGPKTTLEQVIDNLKDEPALLSSVFKGYAKKGMSLSGESSETLILMASTFVREGFIPGISYAIENSEQEAENIATICKTHLSDDKIDALITDIFGKNRHFPFENQYQAEAVMQLNPQRIASDESIKSKLTDFKKCNCFIGVFKGSVYTNNPDFIAATFANARRALLDSNWNDRDVTDFIYGVVGANFSRYGERAKVTKVIDAMDALLPAEIRADIFKKAAEIFITPQKARYSTANNTVIEYCLAVEYAIKSGDIGLITDFADQTISSGNYNGALEIAKHLMNGNDENRNTAKTIAMTLLNSDDVYNCKWNISIEAARLIGDYTLLGRKLIENLGNDSANENGIKKAKKVLDVLHDEQTLRYHISIINALNNHVRENSKEPRVLTGAIEMSEVLVRGLPLDARIVTDAITDCVESGNFYAAKAGLEYAEKKGFFMSMPELGKLKPAVNKLT